MLIKNQSQLFNIDEFQMSGHVQLGKTRFHKSQTFTYRNEVAVFESKPGIGKIGSSICSSNKVDNCDTHCRR